MCKFTIFLYSVHFPTSKFLIVIYLSLFGATFDVSFRKFFNFFRWSYGVFVWELATMGKTKQMNFVGVVFVVVVDSSWLLSKVAIQD